MFSRCRAAQQVRRGRADEADHRVLRQRVQRICSVGSTRERGRHDDGAAVHHLREAAHAEDDPSTLTPRIRRYCSSVKRATSPRCDHARR
jgi:hypothetical protein